MYVYKYKVYHRKWRSKRKIFSTLFSFFLITTLIDTHAFYLLWEKNKITNLRKGGKKKKKRKCIYNIEDERVRLIEKKRY